MPIILNHRIMTMIKIRVCAQAWGTMQEAGTLVLYALRNVCVHTCLSVSKSLHAVDKQVFGVKGLFVMHD